MLIALAIPLFLMPLSPAQEHAMHFADDSSSGRLTLYDGEQPVLAYNYGDQLKEGVPKDRTRSSYVYPIWGLDGENLTDDFPADHHHHRGLSWMWPKLRIDGDPVDIWHIRGIRSYFDHWIERKAEADHAVITVANEWKLDDGRRVADETVKLTVHKANEKGRAIDVELKLKAKGATVELRGQEGKGYGGLNLRFAPRRDTDLTTDKGHLERDSDKNHHAWADLSAKFTKSDAMSGIAIFIAPDHPDAPPPWTLRYYGDLNVAWPGIEPRVLKPGESVTLPYRLWVHRGDASHADVAKAFAAYIADHDK
jgi:hypothetical protein